MDIRPEDSQPMYRQIADLIRQQVTSGELSEGDKLASQMELTEKYRVSRVTIRQAIEALIKEGVLISRQGKGTFVAAQGVSQELGSLLSLSEILEAQGAQHRMSIVGYQWCFPPEDVRDALGLVEEEPALRIHRLHLANEHPIAFASIYLPARIGLGLPRELLALKPIYELMVQYLGISPGQAVQRIRAVGAEGKVAGLLGISPGTPLLWAERITRASSGDPIEHITFFYLADRYQFTINLQRSAHVGSILPG